jgi:2-oxoglutarate ferredoxin oxidoreductase subunit gamma
VNKRILLAGEGGQGVQTIAKIYVKAAHLSGKKVSYMPNFGVEQRGGVSLAYMQIADDKIVYPKFQEADLAIILAHRAVPRIAGHITKNTVILFDNSIISEAELAPFKVEKIAIPASFMAKEKFIPRVFNTIILGALAEELKMAVDSKVKKVLLETLAEKIKQKKELRHFNLAAFELGQKTIKAISNKSN